MATSPLLDFEPSSPEPLQANWEVLQTIAAQVGKIPVAVAAGVATIAAMIHPQVPTPLLVCWVALVLVVLALRWRLLRHPDMTQAFGPQMRRAVWLSFANGAAHALPTLLFGQLPETDRTVITLLLAGLTTGSIATTAGHPQVFRAYALVTIGSLSVAWAVYPINSMHSWLGPGVGALIAVYGLVMVAVANDNHQRLRKTLELRRRETALNQQLVAALSVAESANAAKTRFLASASHDLRQPLHTLALFTAALQAQALNDTTRHIVCLMNQSVQALGEQLSALLDLSKLDADIVKPDITDVPMHPLLHGILVQYQSLADAKQLQLALQCDTTLCALSDPIHLGRIVRNLLDNAVKYTDAGCIWVHAWMAEDGWIRLIIKDTGQGIAQDHADKVFEEFFQVGNPERDRTKGLGLGLSIVQRLVHLLDHELTLDSEPGVGTCFTLSLPQGQMPCPAQAPTEPATSRAIQGMRILVVDDEAHVRAAMDSLLSAHGARVQLASGTFDALNLVKHTRPDIVLADFRLRGEESGIRVIRKLRQMHPELPAMLVSGDTAPDRLQEAQEEGLILLHKPVSAEVLLRAIEHLSTTGN
jgi:signal transduction histidine kinase